MELWRTSCLTQHRESSCSAFFHPYTVSGHTDVGTRVVLLCRSDDKLPTQLLRQEHSANSRYTTIRITVTEVIHNTALLTCFTDAPTPNLWAIIYFWQLDSSDTISWEQNYLSTVISRLSAPEYKQSPLNLKIKKYCLCCGCPCCNIRYIYRKILNF